MRPALSHAPGLQFVLSDGSLDLGKIKAVAATRAVIHACRYDDERQAYEGELADVYSVACGERQIFQMREIAAGRMRGVTLSEYASRELATDGPLGRVA